MYISLSNCFRASESFLIRKVPETLELFPFLLSNVLELLNYFSVETLELCPFLSKTVLEFLHNFSPEIVPETLEFFPLGEESSLVKIFKKFSHFFICFYHSLNELLNIDCT